MNYTDDIYSIIMPPPNITGVLHMGHILNMTIQDVLIQYNKNKGLKTYWIPGLDHALLLQNLKLLNILKKKKILKKKIKLWKIIKCFYFYFYRNKI